MTAADVNVTELVARVINAEVNYATFVPYEAAQDAATAILAALRSPEVVAEIDWLLTRHQRKSFGSCLCGPLPLGSSHPAHQRAVVLDWLTGGAR